MGQKLKRRDLLKLVGGGSLLAGLSPFEIFLSTFLNNAHAQMYGDEFNMNNINLMLLSAPPRWMYDCPLNVNGDNKNFVKNKMVITRFNERTNEGSYDQKKIGKYHMPLLWDSLIPSVDGQDVKSSILLQNMLMLRGVNMGADGHQLNRDKIVQPNNTEETISGLIAGLSSRPIPSASYNVRRPHLSNLGASDIRIIPGGSKTVENFLKVFDLNKSSSFGNKDIEEVIDQGIKMLEENVDSRNIKRRALFKNRQNAKQMFKRDFGNLQDAYTGLQSKYLKLQRTVFSENRYLIGEGVDSGNFLKSKSNDNRYRIQASGGAVHLGGGHDFNDSLNNKMYINGLAESLAVGEFVIKEKISNNFNAYSSTLHNLDLGGVGGNYSVNDSHATGAITTLLFFSKYYQAFNACLYEFTKKIDFSNTLINIHSDFARNARVGGDGSDHGWHGSNVTLLSGKIKEHIVQGNIQSDSSTKYKGSWGKAAKVDELGGTYVNPGNVVATASEILGLKNPISNNESVVSVSNGKIRPNFGAKDV